MFDPLRPLPPTTSTTSASRDRGPLHLGRGSLSVHLTPRREVPVGNVRKRSPRICGRPRMTEIALRPGRDHGALPRLRQVRGCRRVPRDRVRLCRRPRRLLPACMKPSPVTAERQGGRALSRRRSADLTGRVVVRPRDAGTVRSEIPSPAAPPADQVVDDQPDRRDERVHQLPDVIRRTDRRRHGRRILSVDPRRPQEPDRAAVDIELGVLRLELVRQRRAPVIASTITPSSRSQRSPSRRRPRRSGKCSRPPGSCRRGSRRRRHLRPPDRVRHRDLLSQASPCGRRRRSLRRVRLRGQLSASRRRVPVRVIQGIERAGVARISERVPSAFSCPGL